MRNDTRSSGYSSQPSISTIGSPPISNGYDNNLNGKNDEDQRRQRDALTDNVSGSDIKEHSFSEYSRITKFDNEVGRLKQTDKTSNGSRPLPPIPDDEVYHKIDVDVKRRRPWVRISLAIIVLILVVAGALTVYVWRSCYNGWFCTKDERIQIDLTHPCNAEITSNYSNYGNTSCNLDLHNATAMMLQTEGAESVMFNIEDDNVTVEVKGMVISISRRLEGMSIDIEIQEVNCSTIGTHYVTLINDVRNETYKVNIHVNPATQQCPCTSEFDAGKSGFIECFTSSDVNVTVVHRVDNSNFTLINNTDIADMIENGTLPIDGHNAVLHVRLSSSGALFRMFFSVVLCDNAGSYLITLGNTTYETVFKVKSYPSKPVIGVHHDYLGGLILGYYGEVRCEAFVGCGQAPTLYQKVLDEYKPVESDNLRSTSTSRDDGTTFYEAVVFQELIRADNGTEYMCNYTYDGRVYQSDLYTALVVPSTYCDNINVTVNCNAVHPYYCDKYITCTAAKPVERLCPKNHHFFFGNDDACGGRCEIPSMANCQIGR